ncbi:MAG: LCP family protein [Candidatus Dormibacteria bacterium]
MSDPKPQWRPRQRIRAGRRGRRRRVLTAAGILFGFVVGGVGGTVAYFQPAIAAAFGDFGHSLTTAPVPASTVTGAPVVASGSVGAVPSVGAASTGSTSAFTVLLLGSDNDEKFTSGVYLTQSMILARVDPVTKQVTMASIPRDLAVPLPNGTTDKIDKAYAYGGANASVSTVEAAFHVHIDHYAWIGLLGLINLIDKVGGVDVIASNPVLDDFYPKDINSANPYASERVAVLPGAQHMTGAEALMYVRSRHDDLRSDFGRSFRQQQVLLALRAKAKLLGIADLPDIAAAMSNQFNTDMSATQVGDLLPIASNVQLANVHQVILLPPYTSPAQVGGQDILLPNWNLILPLIHQYFPAT